MQDKNMILPQDLIDEAEKTNHYVATTSSSSTNTDWISCVVWKLNLGLKEMEYLEFH